MKEEKSGTATMDQSKTATEGLTGRITLQKPQQEVAFRLPKAQVELLGKEGFRVELERMRTEALHDQSSDMMMPGQGCISSPTGPSC